jgi:hypothetical protein
LLARLQASHRPEHRSASDAEKSSTRTTDAARNSVSDADARGSTLHAVGRAFVDPDRHENDAVLRYLRTRDPSERPHVEDPASVDDPYLSLGSHPDIVERIWGQLGAGLPPTARCVVLGCPALADPETGVVLALALGTTYALRVAPDDHAAALAAGLENSHEYGPPPRLFDAASTLGPDWLFGAFVNEEPGWVASAAAATRA